MATKGLSIRLSRRRFLLGAAALAAGSKAVPLAMAQEVKQAPAIGRKVCLGVVGLGGRGAWIASLFKAHGGFEITAVADYFPSVVQEVGEKLEVPRERRYSGLQGYRRLIEGGVEAVALEAIPYFYPEHAKAAVEAGLHVYMAKPVAVDVPGALAILKSSAQSTLQGRSFLVDYQIPTDAHNQEVAKRLHRGSIGKIAQVLSYGIGGPFADPPPTSSLEDRMQNLIWVSDADLGCDYIGNYGIHALDAVVWGLGQRPVAAVGSSRRARKAPHGDSCDVCSVLYEYADGTVHTHYGHCWDVAGSGDLSAVFHGLEGQAALSYWGKAFVRGGSEPYRGGTVENLYVAGAEKNIARFYQEIASKRPLNDTCPRAVDGVLMSLLGQQAAARRTRLTMEELVSENRKACIDVSGLKV